MKVALGTFACSGIEAHLGPDIACWRAGGAERLHAQARSRRRPVAPPRSRWPAAPPSPQTSSFDLRSMRET